MSGFMLHGLGDCAPERHCGCLDIPAMTAPEPAPTADEHIDAVARTMQPGAWKFSAAMSKERARIDARRLLTTTDPAVHEALAANLPADVMLDALVRAGVLRSPETVDPIAWTIHVEVPTDATEAEVGMLQDRVADAAYGMERGKWDPLVSAHTLDCVASDHCAAPRPDGPPYPKPEVAP